MTRVGRQTVNPVLWDIVGMKNQISERLSNNITRHHRSKADLE